MKHFNNFRSANIIKHCPLSFAGKLVTFLIFLLLFFLGVSIIPHSITYEYKEKENTDTRPALEISRETDDILVLKQHGDMLGIFGKDGILVRAVEIKLSDLTSYDRELISKGIYAKSEEIEKLVEELMS